MRIGLIDSGIGGLNILSLCLKVFDDCSYDYLADTLYAPFGTQNTAFLTKRLLADIEFLASRNADLIILACNTASCLMGDSLPNIIGIQPDIAQACKGTQGKVLVLSTPITARFAALSNTAMHNARIKLIGDAYLAPLIECYAPDFDKVMPYFLQLIEKDLDCKAIVLGCTHYLFLQKHIHKALPYIDIYSYENSLTNNLFLLKNRFSSIHSSQRVINLLFTSSANIYSAIEIAKQACPKYKIFSAIVKIP